MKINDSQRIIDQRWVTSQAEDQSRYHADASKTVIVSVGAASATAYDSKVSKIKGVQVTGGPDANTSGNIDVGTDALAGDRISFDSSDTAALACSVTAHADGVSYATCLDLGTESIEDSINVG